jgi:hypothetical protein
MWRNQEVSPAMSVADVGGADQRPRPSAATVEGDPAQNSELALMVKPVLVLTPRLS